MGWTFIRSLWYVTTLVKNFHLLSICKTIAVRTKEPMAKGQSPTSLLLLLSEVSKQETERHGLNPVSSSNYISGVFPGHCKKIIIFFLNLLLVYLVSFRQKGANATHRTQRILRDGFSSVRYAEQTATRTLETLKVTRRNRTFTT